MVAQHCASCACARPAVVHGHGAAWKPCARSRSLGEPCIIVPVLHRCSIEAKQLRACLSMSCNIRLAPHWLTHVPAACMHAEAGGSGGPLPGQARGGARGEAHHASMCVAMQSRQIERQAGREGTWGVMSQLVEGLKRGMERHKNASPSIWMSGASWTAWLYDPPRRHVRVTGRGHVAEGGGHSAHSATGSPSHASPVDQQDCTCQWSGMQLAYLVAGISWYQLYDLSGTSPCRVQTWDRPA